MANYSHGGKTILVIEDSPEVRRFICETLSTRGWNSVEAVDGLEGIDRVFSTRPDLVLCDIEMPRMNGFEVLKTVRSNSGTTLIPFVFLTGVSDRENIRKGMVLGADDYLPKPFTVEELLEAVEARFRKQREMEGKLEELRGSISLALPHEMITPLNGILGFAYLLENDPYVPPNEVQDFAREIRFSAQRLQRLIENFLFFAQLEIAETDPSRIEVFRKGERSPLHPLLRNLSEKTAKPLERESDIRVELEEAELDAPYRVLEKAFGELLDNAFKFSQKGQKVSLIGKQAGSRYELTIANEGRGLTMEEVGRLGPHMQFGRKFFEQQGTGLGLMIAKKLIHFNGGTLKLESEPNQRTWVTIILPLLGADTPQRTQR